MFNNMTLSFKTIWIISICLFFHTVDCNVDFPDELSISSEGNAGLELATRKDMTFSTYVGTIQSAFQNLLDNTKLEFVKGQELMRHMTSTVKPAIYNDMMYFAAVSSISTKEFEEGLDAVEERIRNALYHVLVLDAVAMTEHRVDYSYNTQGKIYFAAKASVVFNSGLYKDITTDESTKVVVTEPVFDKLTQHLNSLKERIIPYLQGLDEESSWDPVNVVSNDYPGYTMYRLCVLEYGRQTGHYKNKITNWGWGEVHTSAMFRELESVVVVTKELLECWTGEKQIDPLKLRYRTAELYGLTGELAAYTNYYNKLECSYGGELYAGCSKLIKIIDKLAFGHIQLKIVMCLQCQSTIKETVNLPKEFNLNSDAGLLIGNHKDMNFDRYVQMIKIFLNILYDTKYLIYLSSDANAAMIEHLRKMRVAIYYDCMKLYKSINPISKHFYEELEFIDTKLLQLLHTLSDYRTSKILAQLNTRLSGDPSKWQMDEVKKQMHLAVLAQVELNSGLYNDESKSKPSIQATLSEPLKKLNSKLVANGNQMEPFSCADNNHVLNYLCVLEFKKVTEDPLTHVDIGPYVDRMTQQLESVVKQSSELVTHWSHKKDHQLLDLRNETAAQFFNIREQVTVINYSKTLGEAGSTRINKLLKELNSSLKEVKRELFHQGSVLNAAKHVFKHDSKVGEDKGVELPGKLG